MSRVETKTLSLMSLAQAMPLNCLVPPADDQPILHGLACDIPSEILRRAKRGCLLVTSQANVNTIAVACRAGILGIIVTGGGQPPADAVAAARREGIALYGTEQDTFSVVGRLFAMGVGGES